MGKLLAAEEKVMCTEHSEVYNGHPLNLVVCQMESGRWQATAELDLGFTGHVIFENVNSAYATPEEAKAGVMELVAAGLALSRIGKTKN